MCPTVANLTKCFKGFVQFTQSDSRNFFKVTAASIIIVQPELTFNCVTIYTYSAMNNTSMLKNTKTSLNFKYFSKMLTQENNY